MGKKYTAADFANARFAEHPDGRIAARLETEEARPWESVRDFHTDEGIAADGWVPVPTKPTITESRLRELTEIDRTHGLSVRGVLQAYGVEVIPDPEPTNKERLAQLIGGGHESNKHYADGLAEYLDDMGVTAPNAKGN